MFSANIPCFCGTVYKVNVAWNEEDEYHEATVMGVAESADPDTARDLEVAPVCVHARCPKCDEWFPARFIETDNGWTRETIGGFELLGRFRDMKHNQDTTREELAAMRPMLEAAIEQFPDEFYLWEWLDFLCATSLGHLDDEERWGIQLKAVENMCRLNPADDMQFYHDADYAGEGSMWAVKAGVLSNLERWDDAIAAMDEAIRRHPEEEFFKEEREALVSLGQP